MTCSLTGVSKSRNSVEQTLCKILGHTLLCQDMQLQHFSLCSLSPPPACVHFANGGCTGLLLSGGGGGEGGVFGRAPPALSLHTKMYRSRLFSFWCWVFVVKTDDSFLEGCC